MGLTAAILAVSLASVKDLISGERAQQLLPIAVATIAVFFMMLSLRRRQQTDRPRRDPPKPRPQIDPGLYRDLDELMVELQELSRRISAEIDTRFAKLEAVIHDADRRIAALHKLTRGPESAPALNSAPAADRENRHGMVYELADAGFSPIEIARELGKTPGEVELILNLRRKPENTRPETGRQG